MTLSSRSIAVLTFALLLSAASVAEAQIRVGNQIRRQLPGGNREAQPAQQQNAPARAPANRITPELLDKFEVALAGEIADVEDHARREKTREADALKYSGCMMEFVQSPEYEKLMERMNAAAEKNDGKAAQQASQDQVAAMEKACGPNPSNSSSYQSPHDRQRRAAEQAELTAYQYAILKERVPPLCQLDPADDADEVRVQGAGVFTNDEVRAIKPRCARLMPQVRRLS